MASTHYKNNIRSISEYFGISEICAKYIYHRALRSKRKCDDPKYIPYSVKLQNSLVLADKCLGIDWEKILFGKEDEMLLTHGIVIDEQDSTVFRWTSDTYKEEPTNPNTDDGDGWQKVVKKKTKKNNKFAFVIAGIYV